MVIFLLWLWSQHFPARRGCDIIYKVGMTPSLDRGSGHEVPPLMEELLETDGCLEREKLFKFKGVAPGGLTVAAHSRAYG